MNATVANGFEIPRIGDGPSGPVPEACKYLTPAELANRWRWHRESVRRWLRREQIQRIKLGKRLLIPLSVIETVERQSRIGHHEQ